MTSHASRRISAPGEVLEFLWDMNYQKEPLSILEQIDKLQRRGLIVEDVGMAYNYLSNISYYRLRAYTYPFQNNIDELADHVFVRRDIHFMDIIL